MSDKIKYKMLGFVLAAFVLILNCAPDAPHENPLDPFHQLVGESQLTFSGQALHKNPPHPPLQDCLIFLTPEQKFTQSDENGRFEFTTVVKGEHRLLLHKSGYDSLTVQINFDTLSSTPFPFYLNGKPIVKSAVIYSEYIDQWWPDPQTFLLISVKVGDPDGISDLKELRLDFPDSNLSFPFAATVQPDSFTLRLDEFQFPGNSLFSIVGQGTQIVLIDAADSKVIDKSNRLLRIINNSPLTKSPTGLQTVEAAPILVWESYQATFSFSYEIAVYVVSAGIPVLIHQKKNINLSVTEYTYPDSLSSGTYFWTIGIRDEFGNFSRSKEASFLVQ